MAMWHDMVKVSSLNGLFRIVIHPMIFLQRCSYVWRGKALLKMLAFCSFVSILQTFIILFLTASLKWWYLMAMCFVLGRVLGTLASSSVPLLSSKSVQFIFSVGSSLILIIVFNSIINSLSGNISLVVVDKVIYSASVVQSAISVCNLLNHVMGQFGNMMTHPERERTPFGSSLLVLQ